MPKYMIEREIPGVGDFTKEDFQGAAKTSCDVLRQMGPEIQWLHSYVVANKLYCVYIAPNENMIKEHALKGGFPADSVSEIKNMVDPTTAE